MLSVGEFNLRWGIVMRQRLFGTAAAVVGAMLLTGAAPRAPGHDQPDIPVGRVNSEAERVQFGGLISEAIRTLRSDRFRANLGSLAEVYPQVHFRTDPDGSRLVLGTVADLQAMLDASAAPYRYISTPLSLTGQSFEYSPVQIGREGTDVDADGVARGSGTIARGHLWNWNHSNPVIRSCAINTVAHEISHTLVIDTATYRHAFTDFDRFSTSPATPSASYLVGSVAQCTWLQEQGRIPADGLQTCLRVFGVRHFNGARCQQFYPGDVVSEDRRGLSPALTDADQWRPGS